MTFVPGATYDIFISYPRENNLMGLQGVRWVSEFYSHLKEVLDLRIPSREKPIIYFDEKNYESGQELASLLDKARNSAVFLAIVSPSYVARGKFNLEDLRSIARRIPPTTESTGTMTGPRGASLDCDSVGG